jgi:hypothetical protein
VALPLPLTSGDLTVPNILVSLAAAKPNLHALSMDANTNIQQLFCEVTDTYKSFCFEEEKSYRKSYK